MNKNIKAGQSISLKKQSELMLEERELAQKLRITRENHAYIVFVDEKGITIKIKRMPNEINGFIPHGGVGLTNIESFFQINNLNNPGYTAYKHADKIFPTDFI